MAKSGKTRRGVYHNLVESEYKVLLNGTLFYFSSSFIMENFKKRVNENRGRLYSYLSPKGLSFMYSDLIADVSLYYRLETRGFFVCDGETFQSFSSIEELAPLLASEINTHV